MIEHFGIVAEQVMILFILIAVGYFCNKKGLLSKEANKKISDLVVLIVAPCVIILSFERSYTPELLKNFGIAILIAAAAHILMAVTAHFLLRDRDALKRRVYLFGAVFSNAGFIAIPLQSALLGEEGVFYGAAYLVVFNIMMWSYGVVLMSGNTNRISPKKILLSPGIIGVAVGLVLFLGSVRLPMLIHRPMEYLAGLNVPLPMLVVGYYLADTDLKKAFSDKKSYGCMLLRLLVYPLATFGILYACGVCGALLTSMVISLSAPVGATVTMFSEKFDNDTNLSVQLVSLSTLLSMLTMPVIVALAHMV